MPGKITTPENESLQAFKWLRASQAAAGMPRASAPPSLELDENFRPYSSSALAPGPRL